jgi:hypothetical protein
VSTVIDTWRADVTACADANARLERIITAVRAQSHDSGRGEPGPL